MLSQMCLIWKERVLTINPSFVQCRFSQISHSPTPHAQQRKSPSNYTETVSSHGQGLSLSPSSPNIISKSKPQAEGMDIIEEKPNDPQNPPMDTEEIVSVLDRESCLRRSPPCTLNIAHPSSR